MTDSHDITVNIIYINVWHNDTLQYDIMTYSTTKLIYTFIHTKYECLLII